MLNNITDKISIIIPAYNIAEYLPRCLDSVLAQTYKNIELIVVNDGSKDNTEDVIKEYTQKDSRVKLVSKVNEGVTKARMSGIEVAVGEWIGFVDGDDFIEPEMYETLLLNAIKYNASISHCGYQMVFPSRVDYYYNTGKLVEQDNKAGITDLLKGELIEPALVNKLYKKDICKTLIAENKVDLSVNYCEDLLMNYYLFEQAKKSIFNDVCYYHYMVRNNSASTSSTSYNRLMDILKVFIIIKKECNTNQECVKIINSRICSAVAWIMSMKSKTNAQIVKVHQKQAKKELKKLMPEIIKGDYSFKRKLFAIWLFVWPWSYKVVHSLYAKITGSDKKYEVK